MTLPAYIEYTPRGCAPLVSITAPNIRDDGYVSHRDYTPLKSLQLPKQEFSIKEANK